MKLVFETLKLTVIAIIEIIKAIPMMLICIFDE